MSGGIKDERRAVPTNSTNSTRTIMIHDHFGLGDCGSHTSLLSPDSELLSLGVYCVVGVVGRCRVLIQIYSSNPNRVISNSIGCSILLLG